MNPALTPELQEIMATAYYRPAVSIILPFEPKMSQKAVLTHTLKVTADKVERELRENYPTEIVALVMQKLWAIITNLNFNTFKKSIAIYVSPVFEKVLYLDIPVNEKLIIDESFEIRDLVYNKKQQREYLVLLLSGKGSKMYIGNSGSLTKIISDVPGSIYAVINDPPERVSNFSDLSSRREIIMDKFLLHIDNSLGHVLNSYRLPLFVLGNKRIAGHFKSLTRHNNAVIDYIYGNYEDLSEDQLAGVLHLHTAQWQRTVERNLLNQLEDAAGKGKLAVGIRNVWKEAMSYKGRLLVVEKDYMYAALRNSNKDIIYMPSKPYNKFSHVRDAVDDVIEKVLEGGGDVEFVDKAIMKDYHHIALVQYY